MDYQTLVDLITREVITALSSSSTPGAVSSNKKQALIFIDSPLYEESTFFLKLGKLSEFCLVLVGEAEREAQFRQIAPELVFNYLPHHTPQLSNRLEQFSLIICPNPSIYTLSRIADLTGGDPVSDAIIESLQLGKKILMDLSRFTDLFKLSANLSPGFLAKIKERINTIHSYGIKELDLSDLKLQMTENAVNPAQSEVKKCVITKEDTDKYLALGQKTLKFPRGTIITPLAKDELTGRGIEIIFD